MSKTFLFVTGLLLFVQGLSSCKNIFSSNQEAESKKLVFDPNMPPFSMDDVPHNTLKYQGMTFAHEGYDGVRGYGGEMTKPSLDSLLKFNVNAVAIVPYTFMRDATIPTELPIPDRLGSETDEAVFHSVKEAKARGMVVMLKPQIWLGGGSWPGDVNFETEADWDTWFANYEEWIMHYAELSESNNVDVLCIGTELVQTTLKQPDKWRALIVKIRKAYSGKVTYAANWGDEFEGFSFWDALDVVGLNSYYPLTTNENPSDGELLAGAKAWMIKANNISAKAGKPLWLTEVGFRSVEGAWINPHAAAGDLPRSYEAQERCFQALVRATVEAPTLEGMFVWKWPSYLGRGKGKSRWRGEPNRDFTPGGKPAGEVLKKYYEGT